MIESMSNAPGTGDALPASATETVGAIRTTPANGTETGTNANASLLRTIETAIAQTPTDRTDVGLATAAGITISEIAPATIQAEPTTEAQEPAINNTTTEAVEKPAQDAPLFSYVTEARTALADADARGVSFEDRQKLVAELQQALNKEGLLMNNVKIIEVDREIAEARKNGTSKEELERLMAKRGDILSESNKVYTEIFEDIAKYAKRNKDRTGKSFEETISEGLQRDAEDIRDRMQKSLESAETAGDPDELESAKLRLQAAEMHLATIKKKKGKGIRGFINSLILSAGATALGETFKVSKGELTQQKSR